MANESKTVVTEMFAAFGSGDFAGVFARLHPEVVWTSPYGEGLPLDGVFRGHEGVKELFSRFGTAIDILEFVPTRFVAEGQDVIVLGHERVRVKATGKTYENRWVHHYTVEKSLVRSVMSYNDTASVAAASR